MSNRASLLGLFDTPVTAFYRQLIGEVRAAGLLEDARALLRRDFGYTGAFELAEDQLKWFNGQLVRLLRERGLC